jgi:hypothetical protein
MVDILTLSKLLPLEDVMVRSLTIILAALGFIATQAVVSATLAEDLTKFSGTWAYTSAGCQAYINDKLENEADKRNAGLMIIRPTEIEWITPATCDISHVRVTDNRWNMNGKCERKGIPFVSQIIISPQDSAHIGIRVTSGPITDGKPFKYTRCSAKTEWRDWKY